MLNKGHLIFIDVTLNLKGNDYSIKNLNDKVLSCPDMYLVISTQLEFRPNTIIECILN